MKEPTRKEIAEATQWCIDDKWGPRARGIKVYKRCYLCCLYGKCYLACPRCPMHDKRTNCCKEFEAWLIAPEGSKEEIQAAQAVVDKLERIVKEYSEEEGPNDTGTV